MSHFCKFSASEFRRIYARPDWTAKDVARYFGIAHDTAVRKANEMGLPRKPTGYPSRIDKALFAHLWAAGVKQDGIAEACGISRSAVSFAATRFSLPPRSACTMSLSQYREGLLSRAMARDAAAEQRQMILAEMADMTSDGRWVGMLKGAAA